MDGYFANARAKRHRVLICTMGANPEIVTETLWALLTRDQPWQPDSIEIVTTCFTPPGKKQSNVEALFSARLKQGGPFESLPWSGTCPVLWVSCPLRSGGFVRFAAEQGWQDAVELSQLQAGVDSVEEALRMGECIFSLVRGVRQDPDCELHLSLAGGRKTMSAHGLTALTLMGSLQDSASHTLVAPQYEGVAGFWHPDFHPTLPMIDREGQPFTPAQVAQSLTLFEVPLFPVSSMIADMHRDRLINSSLSELMLLLSWTREYQAHPSLHLGPVARNPEIRIGQRAERVNFKIYAALWLLGSARKYGWAAIPTGKGFNASFGPGCATSERFEAYVALVREFTRVGARPGDVTNSDRDLAEIQSELGSHPESIDAGRRADAFLKGVVQQGKTLLERQVGSDLAGVLVSSSGRGNSAWWYHLHCPPDGIVLTDMQMREEG